MLTPKKQKLLIALTGALLLSIILFAKTFFNTTNSLLEAETRSNATLNTCRLIEQFINEADEPHWPTSWDDLAHLSYTESDPTWPAERAYYEAHVNINFEATLEHAAHHTPDSFDLIQPIGDHNGFHDLGYPLVINAAKESIKLSD